MKKYYLSFIFLFSVIVFSFSQKRVKNTDIGIFGGVSYYLGDINPEKHFYAMQPAIGGIFKHTFNPRCALKARVVNTKFTAKDADFENTYQSIRDAEFETNLTDASLMGEFYFLPIVPGSEKEFWSPYITAGIGSNLIFNSTETSYNLALPFGFGFVVLPLKRMTVGVEWTMHKTFNDKLDKLDKFFTEEHEGKYNGRQKSISLTNNDFYSIVGIYLTLKIFTSHYTCPAFARPFSRDDK